jgi:histidinol-phosphate aminotransferase
VTNTEVGVDVTSLVRPAVRAVPSYVPAKLPAERPHREIKLDMNESSWGPSPKAREALATFDRTHRYPDFHASELREALAIYAGTEADRIIPGAGLDDVLNNLFVLLVDPGDEVIISEPTFGVYRALIGVRGGVTVDVPLKPGFTLDVKAILARIGPRTKLVMVCNPNNPTGNVFDAVDVERIVAGAACMVAIDEAYAEFAGISHIPLMERYRNVCVLRTMSKFAGLAGLRVGYGIFPPALMPDLWRVTPAFCNVSAASTAAALASLQDLPYLFDLVARINADRDALAANLTELPGVEPLPSATNFLLVRLPVENGGPVVAELAKRGVHVRHFANPALGIQNCLRVSIGTTEENEVFLHELASILNEQTASEFAS